MTSSVDTDQSVQEKTFKVPNVHSLFISPWKRGVALHLNKFELPLPRNTLWQVWFKLALNSLIVVIIIMYFSYFGKLSSLEKSMVLQLNKRCFMLSLVEIGTVVLEKKMKMCKVFRQTNGQTERLFWQITDRMIRKAHLSLRLRCANNKMSNFQWRKTNMWLIINHISDKITHVSDSKHST